MTCMRTISTTQHDMRHVVLRARSRMRVDAKPTVGLLAACLLLHCSRTSSALNLGIYYSDREESSPGWHDMRAVGDSLEHAGHTVSKMNRAVVSCCALYHLLTGSCWSPGGSDRISAQSCCAQYLHHVLQSQTPTRLLDKKECSAVSIAKSIC